MSRLEPDVADHPSVARCLLDAGLVVGGAVVLAVVLYFLLILGAIVLGIAAVYVLARMAARMML